jgi:hypothetical protein
MVAVLKSSLMLEKVLVHLPRTSRKEPVGDCRDVLGRDTAGPGGSPDRAVPTVLLE